MDVPLFVIPPWCNQVPRVPCTWFMGGAQPLIFGKGGVIRRKGHGLRLPSALPSGRARSLWSRAECDSCTDASESLPTSCLPLRGRVIVFQQKEHTSCLTTPPLVKLKFRLYQF